MNNERSLHYRQYTGQKWDDPANYDLVINTSRIPLAQAVDMIAALCAGSVPGHVSSRNNAGEALLRSASA